MFRRDLVQAASMVQLKRVMTLIGGQLLILVLAACGNTATSDPTSIAPATATTTAMLTTALTTVTTTVAPTTTSPATPTVAPTTLVTPTVIATTADPTTIATTAPPAVSTLTATSGDPAKGKIVFVTNCAACHPQGGTQAGFGPNLSASVHALDPAYITSNVRHGRGSMPPFDKQTVTDADLTNIIAYLKSIHK